MPGLLYREDQSPFQCERLDLYYVSGLRCPSIGLALGLGLSTASHIPMLEPTVHYSFSLSYRILQDLLS